MNPVEEKTKPMIKLPYPSRVEKKDTKEKDFDKFFKLFKKIEINILFFEVHKKMPLYQKFMKEVLLKKISTGEGSVRSDKKFVCNYTQDKNNCQTEGSEVIYNTVHHKRQNF